MERPTVFLVGQASKRGLIPRVPTGERLLVDAEAWLRAEYPDALRTIAIRKLASGVRELQVSLHPRPRTCR